MPIQGSRGRKGTRERTERKAYKERGSKMSTIYSIIKRDNQNPTQAKQKKIGKTQQRGPSNGTILGRQPHPAATVSKKKKNFHSCKSRMRSSKAKEMGATR